MDDPKSLFNADSSSVNAKKITAPDPTALLGFGPKDLLVLTDNPDGTRTFQTFFRNACSFEQQITEDSPDNIIDAAISDLDGDGSSDVVVLERTGPALFINDSLGNMSFDSYQSKPDCRAIESQDVNIDGFVDLIIATNIGTAIQVADGALSYTEMENLPSGDTHDVLLHDFDFDLDPDIVTINMDGLIQFFQNNRDNGFLEVGKTHRALNPGKLKVKDMDNDGAMDIVVEVDSDVHQFFAIDEAFGTPENPPSGRRSIRYSIFDHLGSTKMLLNNMGTVTWPTTRIQPNELTAFRKDLDFDPQMPDAVEASYRLTFTGKEVDHDLDLHYFGSRYYNASLPRFYSPDPVTGRQMDPLSWNR